MAVGNRNASALGFGGIIERDHRHGARGLKQIGGLPHAHFGRYRRVPHDDNFLVDADNSRVGIMDHRKQGVNAQGDDGRGVTDSGKRNQKTEQGN